MITSVLAFVIAFGLLVLVHEFGHFWVARRTGIAVEKFSIGFGPKLFGFKWKETIFQISLFPLGGFVKMKGESEEEPVDPQDPTAFSNKSVKARAAVVASGPFMNLMLSFILMPLVFWIGRPEPTFLMELPAIERIVPNSPAAKSHLQVGDRLIALENKEVKTWGDVLEALTLVPVGQKLSVTVQREKEKKTIWLQAEALPGGEGAYLGFEKFFGKPPPPIVKEIEPNGPADQAGVKAGDEVVKVQGVSVLNWDDLVQKIQSFENNKEMRLEIKRDGKPLTVSLKPQFDENMGHMRIGIQGNSEAIPFDLSTRRYSFGEAVQVGFKANWKNLLLTFQVLKKLVTFELSYKSLGGPVRIAYTLAKASASGLADFIFFTAFLSLQLAVLNLLPIPVLDGGHLLFYLIEGIRKKPLGLKTRMVAQQVGMVLLLTLIVLVTWNDLQKLFFH